MILLHSKNQSDSPRSVSDIRSLQSNFTNQVLPLSTGWGLTQKAGQEAETWRSCPGYE